MLDVIALFQVPVMPLQVFKIENTFGGKVFPVNKLAHANVVNSLLNLFQSFQA